MTGDDRPPIVAAVIISSGRVALVRRRVSEGSLSWQFPAGELHTDEAPATGAERETREEIGLDVVGQEIIGQRVHPATGRTMIYVACRPRGGSATVVDDDELDAMEWCTLGEVDQRIPAGVFPPVRDHLVQATATLAPASRPNVEPGAEEAQ